MRSYPYSPSPKGDATRSLLPRRDTGILRQALAQHFITTGNLREVHTLGEGEPLRFWAKPK
ncbi:MAG: hypothetical protein RM347_032985 [Nostoc sp. ChiQUE02]|uniref:hypothetical protein n=1 Tax=Nostoc sp. ChiQUE02 TaxID=3075377 RepID=UPI002AD4295D|nr:hypothetical protein [Nostoc sp. ChiQUE02]MDZ8231497.1 hypothetical protein [Nostoc sp. ChiQUE02]